MYLLLAIGFTSQAQDSIPRKLVLSLGYYMPDDKVPYLKVTAKEKIERQFFPMKDIEANVYIGEEADENLLGKVKTNAKGEGKVFISSDFKTSWDSLSTITFLAVSEANKDFESEQAEIEITKARIEIDTATDEESKNITVRVFEMKDGAWQPAPEVELKIGIKRLLSNLPVDEEGLFTTDSSGEVTAEFLRDSLYGDDKGNLVLVARTDDHELYGNITSLKTVPWGIAAPKNDFFHKRSLWATRDKTPIWLLFLAYSIVGAVWGVLIYLVVLFLKIRRLGKISG